MPRSSSKLRAAAAVAIAVVSVAAPCPVSAATKQSTWAQGGYDATGSYYNPNESILNSSTLSKAKLRWKAAIPSSTCSTDKGPLVHGRNVFLFSGDRVRALDAATGVERWRSAISFLDRFVGAVAVVDGIIVLGSSSCHGEGPAGRIDGVSAVTGKLVWSYSDEFSLNRVVADRGVVLGADADRGAMVAVDARTGAKLWERRPSDGSARYSFTWESRTAGGRVLVWRSPSPGTPASDSTDTEALDISTGATLWRSSYTWDAVAASPAGDKLFVQDVRSSLLRGLDAGTGRILWTIEDPWANQFAADERSLYASSWTKILRIDAKTGKVMWTRDTKRDVGQPLRAGGLLYVPRVKALLVLNPATGVARTAPTVLAGGKYIPVAIAGGRLYTRTAEWPPSMAVFAP